MSQPTSEFHIDFELYDRGSSGVDVRYWYCLGGFVVGARDSCCTLEAAVSGTEALLSYDGARRDLALASKPLEALYTELYLGLMVDFDVGFEPGKHWQRYSRFQALPIATASFDGWNAFVVESEEHARFIWMPPGRGAKLCQAYLAVGAFESALRSFRRELEDQFRARGSVPPVSGARAKLPVRETG